MSCSLWIRTTGYKEGSEVDTSCSLMRLPDHVKLLDFFGSVWTAWPRPLGCVSSRRPPPVRKPIVCLRSGGAAAVEVGTRRLHKSFSDLSLVDYSDFISAPGSVSFVPRGNRSFQTSYLLWVERC